MFRPETSPTETASTTKPETSHICITMKKQPTTKSLKVDEDGQEFAVHLVFTEVPEAEPRKLASKWQSSSTIVGSASSKNRFCDLVVFAFDSTNEESLAYAKDMEAALLTDDVPRVFVATKGDSG